jgi:AMMECR1 domain-containing protein
VETLRIEISVLTPPQPLACDSPDALLAQLVPGRDGVLLELGTRRATFLPQVWDKLPDKVAFLDQLALKAGGAAGDWRRPDARVSIYTVEHFEEANDPGAAPDPPSLEPGPDPD